MECNYLPKSESTCLCLPIPGKSASGDNFSHGTVVRVLGLAVLLLSLAVLYLFLQIHQLNRTLDSLQMQGASSQVQNNEDLRWKLKNNVEEDGHNSDVSTIISCILFSSAKFWLSVDLSLTLHFAEKLWSEQGEEKR